MRARSIVLAGLVFVAAGLASSARAGSVGIAVAGDSYADEYQFYPPDRSQARNFVEMLSALRGIDFGSFTTSASRGAPRYQGFAYDYALEGSTSADLGPQASGIASQVSAGKVNYALMFIGGNDFLNALQAGQTSSSQLQSTVSSLLSNVESAVQTIAGAGKVKVVVADTPDVQLLPIVQEGIATDVITQAQANAVSAAQAVYNTDLLSAFAGNSNVAVFDAAASSDQFLLGGPVTVDGVTLTDTPSDDYHSIYLADGLHIGTIAQGELLANGFVDTLDSAFGAGIAPLTDQEIVTYAEQAQASSAVPLPPAWGMVLAAAPVMAWVGVRRRRAGSLA